MLFSAAFRYIISLPEGEINICFLLVFFMFNFYVEFFPFIQNIFNITSFSQVDLFFICFL